MQRLLAIVLAWLLGVGLVAAQEAGEAIDFTKARELLKRHQKGETLSAAEQQYLDAARAERQKTGKGKGDGGGGAGGGGGGGTARGRVEGVPTVGQKPLPEMSATDRYRDEDGGLYGGGRNTPPAEHLAAALRAAAAIQPLDAAGQASPTGKVALLAIGMSNTTQEFSTFTALMAKAPTRSPHLVLVDGAQGGQGAEEWVGTQARRTWSVCDERLKAAGITPLQVQVIWLKQAIKSPRPDAIANAKVLQADLVIILQEATTRFPNLRLVYLSSRCYGGYSKKHPEPESFATALAVRWVILDQIAGKLELNADPAKPARQVPVLLWGPDLWADGTTPRLADGLVYLRSDFQDDGVHPNDAGRQKIAGQLRQFFTTDPTTKPWFLAQP